MDKRMCEMEGEWDDFSEGSVETLAIFRARSSADTSDVTDDSYLISDFVSTFQDARAKRAAAAEEEKREKLRKLLGLDKMRIRDSVETIITSEDTLSSSVSSSTDSSGNFCLKDITVSDSQLKLLNIYSTYPAPDDPGLVPALWSLYPPPTVYKDDGIKKFADVSRAMKLRPIARLVDMLQTDEVNLAFYGLDPRIVRALCDAITSNTSVQRLNLQENPLSVDACYHLNDLLLANEILSSLSLSGCLIGPRGARRIQNGVSRASHLEVLDVSRCELGDEGAECIFDGLCDSETIRILGLSDNLLFGDCARTLYYMLAQTESLEELNLSWNSLRSEEFWKVLLQGLLKNTSVRRLDVSWNSLGKSCLPFLMEIVEKSKYLLELNLSNNRFDDDDAVKLSKSLSQNSTLQWLSLDSNPIGPQGALALVQSPVPHLDLDKIWATKDIVPFLESKTVKLGGILSNYKLVGPDPRRIFLKRANFEAAKPKKKKLRRDFGQFVLTLEDSNVDKADFQLAVKRYKLQLTESLVSEIMSAFETEGRVDQAALKKFYLQEYPDTKPPPPKPPKAKKDKKGKKKPVDETAEVPEKKKKKVQMMEPEKTEK